MDIFCEVVVLRNMILIRFEYTFKDLVLGVLYILLVLPVIFYTGVLYVIFRHIRVLYSASSTSDYSQGTAWIVS